MKDYRVNGPHILLMPPTKVVLREDQARHRKGLKPLKGVAGLYEVESQQCFVRGEVLGLEEDAIPAIHRGGLIAVDPAKAEKKPDPKTKPKAKESKAKAEKKPDPKTKPNTPSPIVPE